VCSSDLDRLQEASDRSLHSTAAAASDSNAATPSGQSTPLPALEASEAEYFENTMDAKEFRKQGGIALFDDIN
jgi:hypothetical protein